MNKLKNKKVQYNFEHCIIPINGKLNFSFMRKMLRDYRDIQVCDSLEFGFPIGFRAMKTFLSFLVFPNVGIIKVLLNLLKRQINI